MSTNLGKSDQKGAHRESAPRTVENKADKEHIDAIIDTHFEAFLRNTEKINEGNNGLIFKFDAKTLSPDFMRLLEQKLGLTLRQDSAIKLLKIYGKSEVNEEESAAEHEFNMQRRAYESTVDALKYGEIAGVPQPILYRDLKISTDTKNILKDRGMSNPGSRVEFILMDFVPGQDLAHLLYRKIIKEHPRSKPFLSMGAIDIDKFEDARWVASQLLGFETPAGRHRSAVANEFEKRKVEFRNGDKVYDFLRKRDHLLNPRIMLQIGRTLRLFHENGLAFRDGHERNFMIQGTEEEIFDQTGQREVSSMLIDYGGSVIFEGRYGPHLFEGEVLGERVKYMSDEVILHSLTRISPELKRRAKKSLTQLLSKNDQEKVTRALTAGTAGSSPLERAWQITKIFSAEKQVPVFVAAIKELVGQKQTTMEEATDFVKLILKDQLADNIKKANILRELFKSTLK